MGLVQSVSGALIPRLTGWGFDAVLAGAAGASALGPIALGVLGAAILQGLADLASSFTVELLGQRLERDARDELYVSLLGKSQTFHNRQRVGDIMARAANDVRQLNPMMNPGISLIFSSSLSIVVPMAFIAAIDPRLLLAPGLFVVAFVLALRRYMRQLNPVSFAMRTQFGVMNAGLAETIQGIEVVKSVVSEAAERDRFMGNAERYRDHFVQQGQIQARYLPLLLIGLTIAGAFAHGLYFLAIGELSVGELVAFLGLMGALRFPAFISIFTFLLVQLGIAGASRILDLLQQEAEIDENQDGHVAAVRGEIRFEDVHFGYGPDKDVIRGMSFTVQPGQTVAIVGQTGSGKSTLTKLVNRTYDTTAGRITIDGVDVRDWNLQSLRPQISVIEQDVFLFSRTVAENIAFGLGERATDQAIREAAEAAQAGAFIRGFADGYDTVVGERGMTLSGGQRQRLAIARALLTDPRILVLDDSTSAVDSATEDAIQRAIDAVLQGRTTLIITHRLSQIRRADHILVLHQGEVVDQGGHDELLERCALYQRIFARVA
ncbi:MAG: ABC transporter ATP-binding protein/permease [Myxococcales bacterium]|nr:ABC transporter ATP-binding protein/permease [Myxococcales bacterium]